LKIKRGQTGNNVTTIIKKNRHGGLKKLVLADFLFKDKAFIEDFIEAIKTYQAAGFFEIRNIVMYYKGRYELCAKMIPIGKKDLSVLNLSKQKSLVSYEKWTTFVETIKLPKQLVENQYFVEAVSQLIRKHGSNNPLHVIEEDVLAKDV